MREHPLGSMEAAALTRSTAGALSAAARADAEPGSQTNSEETAT